MVADPENPDTHAALRVKVGNALNGSPELLTEIVDLLRQAGRATASSGDRSVAGTLTGSNVVTGRWVPPAGR
ncbi:hypothetical protein [Actinoplanes regularis]|uniref:hypothetical protein n=1 Tax=Actinoplanes regularis TaxID=52697 RepID=UPI0024A20591|nr:hypothetical protein [Actinoplanes regularis]GLW34190.1 hypothetical protein Areg01_71270 [Actinoplanes regularis]